MPENFEANNQPIEQANNQYQYANPQPVQPVEEKANVGLAILSFIIPLVGIILFFSKKKDKPKTAKACGIAALVTILLSVVSSIIMTVAGGALFGAAVNEVIDDTSTVQDGGSLDADDNNATANTGDNVIGDFVCVVKNATLTKDYDGKDAIIITYDFTNNSDDSQSFDMALMDSVYQDGVELDTAILLDEETESWDVKIKPGVTKEVKKAYVLNNKESDLEVEISEFLSWDDDKIVTTVTLP